MNQLDNKSLAEIEEEIQKRQAILDEHWNARSSSLGYNAYNREEMMAYYEKSREGKEAKQKIKKQEEYNFFTNTNRFSFSELIISYTEKTTHQISFFSKEDLEGLYSFETIFDLVKEAYLGRYDILRSKIEENHPKDFVIQEKVMIDIRNMEFIVQEHLDNMITKSFHSWCFNKCPFGRNVMREKKEQEILEARRRYLTEDPIIINKGEDEYI